MKTKVSLLLWLLGSFLMGCSEASEEQLEEELGEKPIPGITIVVVSTGKDWIKVRIVPESSAAGFAWKLGNDPRQEGTMVDGNVERIVTLENLSPATDYVVSAVAWNENGETGETVSLTVSTRQLMYSNYVEYNGVQYELFSARIFCTSFVSKDDHSTYFSKCLELSGEMGTSVLLTVNTDRPDLIPYYKWQPGGYALTEASDQTGQGVDGETTCVVCLPEGWIILTGTFFINSLDDKGCSVSCNECGVRVMYNGLLADEGATFPW